jgi:hypothetical protein
MVPLFRGCIYALALASLSLFVVLLPLRCNAGGALSLQKTAPFAKELSVPDAVRDKCELETKVVDFTESFAKDDFDTIMLVSSASASTPGKALAITITDLSGAAGGAWSGPKHLTIGGTLWQDGKVLGTFTATRVTTCGAFSGYQGTCSLLRRCAKVLGKDVAGWLKNPSKNAKLGETR